MKSHTTETILDTTVYGTASGNYDGSSQDFISNEVRAANYYFGQGSIQTVNISVTGFVGRIRIQASLNDQRDQAEWFLLNEFGDGSSAVTEFHPISIVGNFVWLRVEVVNFDAGTINSVTVTY